MASDVAVHGLQKRFGAATALADVSFTAQPGRVTGLLGPNGSGKTTTLRILLGLTKADAGTALVGGTSYRDLAWPTRTVGAVLEPRFHAAASARNHLRIAATAAQLPLQRVQEVIDLVGLSDAADRAIGGYSLGMRQRLALATALLGDPEVLILDEPINGLDPAGILWIRQLLRYQASIGKTVVLSSHVLSEVEHTVDDVAVLRLGRVAYSGPLGQLRGAAMVRVEASDLDRLEQALRKVAGAAVERDGEALRVRGMDAEAVGAAALEAKVALRHLSSEQSGVEEAFLKLMDAQGVQA